MSCTQAAYRIHLSLLKIGVESKMWVNKSITNDPEVETALSLGIKFPYLLRRLIVFPLVNLLKTQNPIIHSPSILNSKWTDKINNSDADIVHLHWIQGEMLSIADIEKIKKPLVWTLHDMWGFCGAEHYTEDNRWRIGYTSKNRPAYESWIDLNKWTWKRKLKHWRSPKQIVTPSRWLKDCVSDSALMHDWPVCTIANPLDTDQWRPFEKNISRKKFDLPSKKTIILFGSMGGGDEPRKGFDLLVQALSVYLRKSQNTDLELVVFGLNITLPLDANFKIRQIGKLSQNDDLCMLYSAADILAAPSRLEVFGQTASEAHACGTPVIAFRVGGLPDIIKHKVTGYLADPFDVNSMAVGIEWLLDQKNLESSGHQARIRAISSFSEPVIAEKYKAKYLTTLARKI